MAVDVSILTPSLGYGRFIEDNLRSVANQAGVTIDHVVQDAGSTDETIDVLRRFPGVRWVSEADEGQSDALNKALARSTGRWVGWLNADEFYLPGGLSDLIEVGERDGADVVYGDSTVVDASGRLIRLSPQHSFSRTILRWYGPFIPSNSAIFRRSLLEREAWDPELRIVMDWEFYLRCLQRGARFTYVPRPVGAFRLHPDQVTAGPGAKEGRRVRARYGIPQAMAYRRVGRWVHGIYKLLAGGYLRQNRARSLHGSSLRWFSEDADRRQVEKLFRACYGIGS